jgi:hypothetical protein
VTRGKLRHRSNVENLNGDRAAKKMACPKEEGCAPGYPGINRGQPPPFLLMRRRRKRDNTLKFYLL